MLCICLGEASLAMTAMSLASDAPFPGAHLGVIKVSGPTKPPPRGFMARDFDGWPIAEQRIAKEARELHGQAGSRRSRAGVLQIPLADFACEAAGVALPNDPAVFEDVDAIGVGQSERHVLLAEQNRDRRRPAKPLERL
jgi:hypothetical protein